MNNASSSERVTLFSQSSDVQFEMLLQKERGLMITHKFTLVEAMDSVKLIRRMKTQIWTLIKQRNAMLRLYPLTSARIVVQEVRPYQHIYMVYCRAASLLKQHTHDPLKI